MAKYVDGYVLVVPKDKVSEYRKMAKEGAEMWMKYGALEYFECQGDDLTSRGMDGVKALAFTKMAKAKPSETVWFSFIVYKSKKHRDQINAKVVEGMKNHIRKDKDVTIPFDVNRMAYGGFRVVVEG